MTRIDQGRIAVVLVTRLNGPGFALNPDLIEKVESTPDTVVTLVDGTKYLLEESLDEIVELILRYRALVVARAGLLETQLRTESDGDGGPIGTARPQAGPQQRRRSTTRAENPTVVQLPHRER